MPGGNNRTGSNIIALSGYEKDKFSLTSRESEKQLKMPVVTQDHSNDSQNKSRELYRTQLTDLQLMRRKTYGNARSSSPTVSTDTNSETHVPNENCNDQSALSRSRKRARSEVPRMGSTGSNNLSSNPLLRSVNDDQEDSEDGERVALNKGNSRSDIEEDGFHTGNDFDVGIRGRHRRQTYQLNSHQRDSSLGRYTRSTAYGSSGGTLPRRQRMTGSLTRATTISGVDPHGTLRSACRLAHSIRAGIIPPPPSEPPPATPLSGSLISELESIGPNAVTGLLNPFALQLHNSQQQQQQQQALAAAVAAAGGFPQVLSGVNQNNLTNSYMLSPALLNAETNKLLQLQQAKLIAQHQVGLVEQQLRQQQQQQQQQQQLLAAAVAANSLMQNPTVNGHTLSNGSYLQGFGTYGRTSRPGSTIPPSMQSYLSPGNLLAVQQQQQLEANQLLLLNDASVQMSTLNFTGSPSVNLLNSELNEAASISKSSADCGGGGGGSGSVVYENSYSSFNKLLTNSVLPDSSLCQPGLQSFISTNGSNPNDAIYIGNSQNVSIMNGTIGHDNNTAPPLVQTFISSVQQSQQQQGRSNNPGLIDSTRSIEPTYSTTNDALRAKSKSHSDSVVVVERKSKRHCPWYYWIISILILAFLLALVLAVSFSEEKKRLDHRLQERFAQDPAIIGLFDPNSPPYILEANKPVNIVLEPMKSWSGQWHMPTARYIRYNITVSSLASSIGIFMRHNTMPTIIHYDIFDRITGHNLLANSGRQELGSRTKRSTQSTNRNSKSLIHIGPKDELRETGRLHYLDEGIWFLALVNDQPRREPIKFAIGDAVMRRGCPNDCSNRGVCDGGVCDCVNGFKGPDCSIAELPKVCSGHGDYASGACRCYPEWKGQECQTLWSECEDPTCSGNGRCVVGECQCYEGYAGNLCQTRTCISFNCSGHGVCMNGNCRCFNGWSGIGCELPVPNHLINSELIHPSNGASTSGNTGNGNNDNNNNNKMFNRLMMKSLSSPSSSSVRAMGLSSAPVRLLLDAASEQECTLDCSSHGVCEYMDGYDQPVCRCFSGWTGSDCSTKRCDTRCFINGHCTNGTCICKVGWNGKYCTLDGCPDHCNGHGQCIMNTLTNFYYCQCSPGWSGSACQRQIETICDDGIDNDHDDLVDCLDPDCCTSTHCDRLIKLGPNAGGLAADNAQQSCAHSESFDYYLLITPIAPLDSAFYGQLEFLLRRERIVVENFDPRRISVVRGVVRQWDGTVFWGCRVSDRANMQNGYTLTDKNGRFDLPVDGGTIVQLEFLRYPTDRFSAIHNLYVPVNQIVNMGDFYMYDAKQLSHNDLPTTITTKTTTNNIISGDFGGTLGPSPIHGDLWIMNSFMPKFSDKDIVVENLCISGNIHDIVTLGGPYIQSNSLMDISTICLDEQNVICVRNGALMYNIPIKDTQLRLIYRSDRTSGYKPGISIHLLASNRAPPLNLKEIHLVIDIAGQRHVKLLEPEPGLLNTFYWNKTDGYNRSVYGLAEAKVSVGYAYTNCPRIFWEYRVVQLPGSELISSDLANWNLNILHTYAVSHGIIYRGDGSHFYLKQTDWHISAVIGLTEQRRPPNDCSQCSINDKPTRQLSLRNPYCLLTDSVGNLLIGDGGFLRWLNSTKSAEEYKSSSVLSSSSLSFRAPLIRSDSLNSPFQEQLKRNDRRRWETIIDYKLDFLQSNFDEDQLTNYFITVHPNYIYRTNDYTMVTLLGNSGNVGGADLSNGLFLSHTSSKSIWWLKTTPDLSAHLLIGGNCQSPSSKSNINSESSSSTAFNYQEFCIKQNLKSPKGIVATQTELYFIDSQSIWSLSLRQTGSSTIPFSRLVIGSDPNYLSNPKSLNTTTSGTSIQKTTPSSSTPPCDRSVPGNQMLLNNPEHLAFSTLEQTLYFSDNDHVYRYHLVNQMVSLAAGRLKGCPIKTDDWSFAPLATQVELGDIRGLSVSAQGDLFIAGPQHIWIRRSNDNRLYPITGIHPSQPRQFKGDVNNSKKRHSSTDESVIDLGLVNEFSFNSISSITVSLFGELFVADNSHNRVYRIHYQLPEKSETGNTYRILYSQTDEIDSFGSYGQLISTESASTQMISHRLDYRNNEISGWLSQIRGDDHNIKLSIHRDTHGNLLRLQTPTGHLYNVTLEPGSGQRISTLVDPVNGGLWKFLYSSDGLLTYLKNPQDSSYTQFHYAPESGRLLQITYPNAKSIDVARIVRSQIPVNMRFHTLDEVSNQDNTPKSDSTNTPDQLSTVIMIQTTDSNKHEMEIDYGDSNNLWKVLLAQVYQIRKDLYAPVQLVRQITIPGNSIRNAIEHTNVWTYHLNDQSNPRILDTHTSIGGGGYSDFGVNFDKKSQPYHFFKNHFRRSISAQNYLSGSDLHRSKRQMSHPFSKRFTARSIFNYNDKNYNNLGEEVDWHYQKTLTVNGQNLLNVNFNWALQLETYQHASTGHILLQVVYNANFQPMIFNASANYLQSAGAHEMFYPTKADYIRPATLILAYTKTGHLSAVEWGNASYHFSYDVLNRLKAADLGRPADTLSFQYGIQNIPFQPTMVSVSGSGLYTLLYSDSFIGSSEHQEASSLSSSKSDYMGLSGVITPTGLRRQFTRINGIKVNRLMFTPWLDSPGSWVYEWGSDVGSSMKLSSDHSHLLRFIWPSSYRRISIFPKQNFVIYDKTSVRWDSNGLKQPVNILTAPLVQLTDTASGFRLQYQRTFQGSLLQSLHINHRLPGVKTAHPNLGGILNAKFTYGYDLNMNLISIHTSLFIRNNEDDFGNTINSDDKTVLNEESSIRLDSLTGRVLTMNEFTINHQSSSLHITYNLKNIQIYRQWDDRQRIIQCVLHSLNSRRELLYNLSLSYQPNALQALQQREEREGQVPRWITYVHGPGGRIEAVDREEAGTSLRSHSQLIYNAEGRIAHLRIATSDPQLPSNERSESGLTSRSEELQFIYDSRGLLAKRGNWHYNFDEDGFLIKRHLHNLYITDQFAYNSKGLLIWAERAVDKSVDSSSTDNFHSTPSSSSPLDQWALEDDAGLKRSYSVQFIYDSEDRLIIVRDTLIVRDSVQYFYADPKHPTRVTHIFNHGRLKTIRLLYDPVHGHVFALEQYDNGGLNTNNGKRNNLNSNSIPSPMNSFDDNQFHHDSTNSAQKRVFFIITNHEGSPTAAFSENGKLAWAAEYSATGSRRLTLSSRNNFFTRALIEEVDLPLGQASCITDFHTGFLFCPPTSRAYDPLGATFTSPDWRGLISTRLPNVKRDPSVLDTHKWGLTEQEALGTGPNGLFAELRKAMTSPIWWLKQVGFNLDNFLTKFDTFEGKVDSSKNSLKNSLPLFPIDITSIHSFDCIHNQGYKQLNSKFEHLSMLKSNQLTPGGPHGSGLSSFLLDSRDVNDEMSLPLLPANTMFGPEVSLRQFIFRIVMFISLERISYQLH
ncbi:Teneurin-2 [Schistosoma haematobium]|uniref:Teneurin-2 n=1 Tax=Schistosoma haematobium TaxID=6185 RepID=A0A922S216_SCHHA|nr:Teneurin-2 [Schistosoma haematobium]KAH9590628.1 Teneurin-2 [Schistosoma haematobium]